MEGNGDGGGGTEEAFMVAMRRLVNNMGGALREEVDGFISNALMEIGGFLMIVSESREFLKILLGVGTSLKVARVKF